MFADRQGSILWVADPVSSEVVAAYEYDGFGKITQTQGELQQPYGYTGREYDLESGLYHYRMRSFDPVSGFFVQSDPVGFEGGSLGLYTYVDNSPFAFVDPTGLTPGGLGTTKLRAGSAGAHSLLGITLVGEGAIGVAGAIARALKVQLFGGANIDTSIVPPPGGCSRLVHQNLEKLKPNPDRCEYGLPVSTNLRRMSQWSIQILARTAIMNVCFNSGDPAHRAQRAADWIPFKRCHGILTKSWKKKPK